MLFYVLHCLSEALIFLPERRLILLLDVAQVSVTLIPQLFNLLTSFQVKVIVLLLTARELVFKGSYLVIV